MAQDLLGCNLFLISAMIQFEKRRKVGWQIHISKIFQRVIGEKCVIDARSIAQAQDLGEGIPSTSSDCIVARKLESLQFVVAFQSICENCCTIVIDSVVAIQIKPFQIAIGVSQQGHERFAASPEEGRLDSWLDGCEEVDEMVG